MSTRRVYGFGGGVPVLGNGVSSSWAALPQSSQRLQRCSVQSKLTGAFPSHQEQPSEKGEPSEIHSEVATQNSPTNTSPLINNARQRSSKSPASSGSKSPHHTDAPKRGGRRSSSGPARRASVDRSQRGILQTIHSRRRSGASEANLMGELRERACFAVNFLTTAASAGKFHLLFLPPVSRSWADVVKLSAKQTQTKVMRHGPPRPGPPRHGPSKRQRRVNTPKVCVHGARLLPVHATCAPSRWPRSDTLRSLACFPEASGQRSQRVQHRPRRLSLHHRDRESSHRKGQRACSALQDAEQLHDQQKNRLQ